MNRAVGNSHGSFFEGLSERRVGVAGAREVFAGGAVRHRGRGFIHEVAARTLRAEAMTGEMDAYSCGPPPMIDAVIPVLQVAGVEPSHIHFDKFTQPAAAVPEKTVLATTN